MDGLDRGRLLLKASLLLSLKLCYLPAQGGHLGLQLPPGSLGFLQLGGQGLVLDGCGCLSLLRLLQLLEQLLLPPLGSAELLLLRLQPCPSLSQLLDELVVSLQP